MNNVLKFLACDQTAKITCVDTTQLVKSAKQIHNLSIIPTKVFGEILTLGALLGADLKDDDENLTIQINTNGLLGKILCVAKKGSKIKGYIQNGQADSGEMFGQQGQMNIIKDIGLNEPYIGTVEIEQGKVTEAFTTYFAKSEQIPTALSVGVAFDDNGEILVAGGYMIQLMPDATEETITKLENNISTTPQMTTLLKKGNSLFKVAQIISGEEELMMLVGEINNEYVCDCSRERMEKGLISLGKKELDEIVSEEKPIETKCQFCNKEYTFSVEDIKKLLEEAI